MESKNQIKIENPIEKHVTPNEKGKEPEAVLADDVETENNTENNKAEKINHCQLFYDQLVAFGFKVPQLPTNVSADVTVPELIKQWGANGFDANAVGQCGEPLLIWLLVHYHCRDNLSVVVKTLLRQPRANVNVTHKNGNFNALATLFVSYVDDYAEHEEARETVRRLVNVLMKHGINLNHVDDYGLNALWYLCLIDGPQADEMIALYRRFISAGVDVNLKAEKYGRYALVELLHDKLNSAYSSSWTGRHYFDIIRLFVDHDFNVNHADCYDSNVLMILAGGFLQRPHATHKLDIVNYLIGHGVDVTQRDCEGNNVLDILLRSKDYPVDEDFHDIVKLLMRHGASDHGGANALVTFLKNTKSITAQSKQVISTLIEYGVDVHHEDDDGNNALSILCKRDLPIKQIFMMARFLVENHRVRVKTEKCDALLAILCHCNAKSSRTASANDHDYLHLALLVELFLLDEAGSERGEAEKQRMTRALAYSLRHHQRDDFAKVVQLLCRNGADTSAVYQLEATPVVSPRPPVFTMRLNFEECMAILNWSRGGKQRAADSVRPERSPSVVFKRSTATDVKKVNSSQR